MAKLETRPSMVMACSESSAESRSVPPPCTPSGPSRSTEHEAPEKHSGRAVLDAADTDPSLPPNWSSKRKWMIVIVLSLMSLMVNMSLVICAPASSAIAYDFGNHDSFLSVIYITVPNLGQVISPLYVGPLSERLGRMPVCHFFNALFLIFTMVAGFSNSLPMVIVFRFLAGSSIASICLNPAITGDLFAIKKRGSAMSITSMIPILGTAVGPIAGGYITQYLSWRWTFWMMAIITGGVSILMALVLKESYVPVIRRKALRKASSNQERVSSSSKYLTGWNMATVKALALLVIRPFVILSRSRIAVLMGLYLAILFAYISLVAATLATIFQEVYGFSESQSGLVYIALTIGTLSGALMCNFTLDYFLQRGLPFTKPVAHAGTATMPRPENRLIPIIPAMLVFPVGLLLYGWSLQRHFHWIVPTIATVLCGFSLSSSTTPIMNYLVDVFGDRAASAVAAVLPLRYIAGAFLPVAAPYMYATLGYGWGNSLLAFVLCVVAPIPLLVIVQPQRMRALTAHSHAGIGAAGDSTGIISEAEQLNDVSESSPLLSDQVKDVHTLPPRLKRRIILLLCAFAFTMMLGDNLQPASLSQIFEDLICDDHFNKHLSPNTNASATPAPANRCKTHSVQKELALVRGIQQLVPTVAALLCTVPYGLLAERIGRKRVLILSGTGTLTSLSWVLAVCYWRFGSIRLVWLSGAFLFIGGGDAVTSSVVHVMVTDTADQTERARIFLFLHAADVISGFVGPAISAALMEKGDAWAVMLLAQAMLFSGTFLLTRWIPETLGLRNKLSGGSPSQLAPSGPAKTAHPVIKSLLVLNRQALLLLFIFAPQTAARDLFIMIGLQYSSSKFSLSYSRGNVLLSLFQGAQGLVALAILPLITSLVVEPRGWTSWTRDRFYAIMSIAATALGLMVIAAAPTLATEAVGLLLVAVGSCTTGLLMSLLGEAVQPSQVSTVYSVALMLSIAVRGVTGPLMNGLFVKGLELGWSWMGLPFAVMAVLMAGVMVMSTFIPTGLVRHMAIALPEPAVVEAHLKFPNAEPVVPKTRQQGCATTMVAALDPALQAYSGSYLNDCQLHPEADFAADKSAAERLWTLSKSIVGI
ncbi:hypothetical protein CDV55_104414 [Aspergillus turcosus]|uniref:Major facilitator superfamily (MFS) profile domain-containing protein n=1 Tax=Aspergillus turcosus TaxID=1245748 RepID=A0A397I8J4_9EURO|nr:hypothetical protein CDV55_104414 [Aspergillus turcosus]RLM00384.1 hypothetical protein CFD26_107370 [Aspergillus turcosus]